MSDKTQKMLMIGAGAVVVSAAIYYLLRPSESPKQLTPRGEKPAQKPAAKKATPSVPAPTAAVAEVVDETHACGKYKAELIQTAKEICAPGKGILAADESTGTIGKRFDTIDVENTLANRKAYRELLFTTPDLNKHISGVIMFDETCRDEDKKFCDLLRSKNIHCGIKVDTGLQIISGTAEETATQGLDGLGARCAEYYKLGCRFAKWRAVLKIGNGLPSDVAIEENAVALARYGSICQQNGLVPIIEPEILQDGDHDIEVCAEVSERVFAAVMKELFN